MEIPYYGNHFLFNQPIKKFQDINGKYIDLYYHYINSLSHYFLNITLIFEFSKTIGGEDVLVFYLRKEIG